MNIPFEIIVGTYEEFLLGYKPSNNLKNVSLTQTFATHEHSSSIRCVSVCGHYLATGAADDRIVIYDMKTRKEHCMLTHHNGTVNCVEFTHGHTHLISGSSDGALAIVRVGNWQLEKLWEKAHKGSAILDIAVHTTGKLALTLGSDCTLRTWNLIKGRQAYAINLNSKSADAKSLDKIVWNPNGQWFSLSGGFHTEVWSIETGGMVTSVQHKSKVASCCWLNEETLVSGLENGQLCIYNAATGKETLKEAHSTRIKCLKCTENLLVSADSEGHIKVWNLDDYKLIAKCSTGCRITCMDLVPLLKVKKEQSNDEADSSSSLTIVDATESKEEFGDDEEDVKVEEEEKPKIIKNETGKKRKSMQAFVVETVEDSPAVGVDSKEEPKKKRKKKKNSTNAVAAEEEIVIKEKSAEQTNGSLRSKKKRKKSKNKKASI